jgi:hypothetical protein
MSFKRDLSPLIRRQNVIANPAGWESVQVAIQATTSNPKDGLTI